MSLSKMKLKKYIAHITVYFIKEKQIGVGFKVTLMILTTFMKKLKIFLTSKLQILKMDLVF